MTRVAARLSDPESVRKQFEEALAQSSPPDTTAHWWHPSLSDGYAGLSLLFSELRFFEPDYRSVVHEHITRAVKYRIHDPGVINGLAAVAFASSRSAQHGDHAILTRQLDSMLEARVRSWTADGAERHTWYHYDVISGLAGIGRYLLSRPATDALVLRNIADMLAALAEPRVIGKKEVPGWWVDHDLEGKPISDPFQGHANLGLAHGIPGCFATLALLVQAGHGDDRHVHAIQAFAAWILHERRRDAYGVYWPTHRSLVDEQSRHRANSSRAAWCYGTPGIARALQIAGAATGEPAWESAAIEAVKDLAKRPEIEWGVADASLCHGWGGLLQTFSAMHRQAPEPVLERLVELTATRAIAQFRPDSLFGFRSHTPGGRRLDRPGFLEGSAGTALALHAYSTGLPPKSGWDQALLLN
ncbi:lanthionine synthetase C family protein [Streptomyces sp. NPDC048650]|uniref:lanthionine synthetase C family protein n=1 Tax=unclassified Streptomyces TaxID=2593676 RepID=UPI00372085C4